MHSFPQGELEHRTPKARYRRTVHKHFVKQLAQIERRATRLRRIRARLVKDGRLRTEQVASTPEEHHHIAASQNEYVHIGYFLQRHSGDPAIEVRG